ncbi:glycosyltransferase [Acidianus sulfidivorans JP7]|uniref:N-acetylglucosaminyltransferase n=1 Tax=Acidianus sulfidivorans JP7 TaxID=619593 RepID=A0A2U9IJS5_9CREN|nr:glycosyltransferase [Acidianus sulfidivorans]AWR96206.1 glycosyltransferase [Acidianus sulfidivorans JP7]
MLFELLNILYMIENGVFIYFPINFAIFFVLRQLLLRYHSKKYRPYKSGLTRDKVKVSVVIPEYNEDLAIFEKCVRSAAKNNPDEIIVVHDDKRKEIVDIAKKYGAKVISSSKRLGKRAALILGWLNATGDIIVQLDSDTIMEKNTVDEIIKPFADPKVAGVQGRPVLFRTDSRLSYLFGQIIEYSRDVVCRALNGTLNVIDGKIAAYRRTYLLESVKYFNTENYGKNKIVVADDKALTYYANMRGYKTVYQSTAVARSAAQPTLLKFLNQQLRWARSGYLYLIKEIKSGLFFKMPGKYRFHMLTYLLAPFSFALALIDELFVPGVTAWSLTYLAEYGFNIPLILYSVLIFILGMYLSMKISFKLLGLKLPDKISFIDSVTLGVIGLFVIFPMFIYAAITHFGISEWRGGSYLG